MPTSNFEHNFEHKLEEAVLLESRRDYLAAAALLDETLSKQKSGSPGLLFRALVLRTDLAISLNALGEARGILAEARQVPLSKAGKDEKDALEADLRRADDLETFLTHRGCAG